MAISWQKVGGGIDRLDRPPRLAGSTLKCEVCFGDALQKAIRWCGFWIGGWLGGGSFQESKKWCSKVAISYEMAFVRKTYLFFF